MKAIRLHCGDDFRYRGKRYTVHGLIKLYDYPDSEIRILIRPFRYRWTRERCHITGGKWIKIPGDHTAILERRSRY